MSEPDTVARAEVTVRQARGRFERTLGIVQSRLKPARVARDAWDGAKEKSVELAQDAAEVVRKKPALVGLAAAGVAAFFARGRIMAGAKRLFQRESPAAAQPPKHSRRPRS